FEPAILRRLLESPPAPITVTVDRKASYDADDMKVRVHGTRLTDIGKTLPLETVNGESIGLLLFRGNGPRLFAEAVDRAMRMPEGLQWWYLKVIGQLAGSHHVETVSIEGMAWSEVDFPVDLIRAQRMVEGWRGASAADPTS
ncbi:MAG: nucleotidyltransferase, partial [Dongiaceae bacterium]